MKIPGLDDLLSDLNDRGDTMQDSLTNIESTLGEIKELMVLIEENTRPRQYKLSTTTQAGHLTPED